MVSPIPHLSCIRPKLSSFLKSTFPCFLARLLLPELHLHPLPSHPTHLAVVVWVAPIDDDDPLPLLRPYSKRPEGLRHIYFANSSRPCCVNRWTDRHHLPQGR